MVKFYQVVVSLKITVWDYFTVMCSLIWKNILPSVLGKEHKQLLAKSLI